MGKNVQICQEGSCCYIQETSKRLGEVAVGSGLMKVCEPLEVSKQRSSLLWPLFQQACSAVGVSMAFW